MFRIPMLLAALCTILLIGCGDGISGSALGQDPKLAEALQIELADTAKDITVLAEYYNDTELQGKEILDFTQRLVSISENLAVRTSDAGPETLIRLEETRRTLWQIENSLNEIIDSRERLIGELLDLITSNITDTVDWYSTGKIENNPVSSNEKSNELASSLDELRTTVIDISNQLFGIETTLNTLELSTKPESQSSSKDWQPVSSPVVIEDDDVGLIVTFDSGVDGASWGNGTYTKCSIGATCGALSSGIFGGREVYVKPNANSDDPTDDWYYAYVFHKWEGQTWILQYVSPALTDSAGNYLWNAHRYGDCENPWDSDCNWSGLTVSQQS